MKTTSLIIGAVLGLMSWQASAKSYPQNDSTIFRDSLGNLETKNVYEYDGHGYQTKCSSFRWNAREAPTTLGYSLTRIEISRKIYRVKLVF